MTHHYSEGKHKRKMRLGKHGFETDSDEENDDGSDADNDNDSAVDEDWRNYEEYTAAVYGPDTEHYHSDSEGEEPAGGATGKARAAYKFFPLLASQRSR